MFGYNYSAYKKYSYVLRIVVFMAIILYILVKFISTSHLKHDSSESSLNHYKVLWRINIVLVYNFSAVVVY